MIISFAWTSSVLMEGKKTVTRRQWTESYFKKWCGMFKRGLLIHQAYDKVPYAGGKKLCDIKLTHIPYKEKLKDMPESDVQAEGGLWKDKKEFISLFGDPEMEVTVIRFKPILKKEKSNADS